MEKSPSLPAFNASLYPRIYKISAGWSAFLLIFGFLFIGLGIFLLWMSTAGGAKEPEIMMLFAPLSALLGIYIVADTLKSRVILYADAIEIHDLMPVRRLERAGIKGRKLLQTGQAGANTVIFVPHDPAVKKIKLPLILRQDDALRHWIETLPDLDFMETKEATTALLQDAALGATPDERLAALASAKKTAKVLTIATYVLFFCAYIFAAYGTVIAVTAAFPWLALALAARSPGLYSLNDSRKDIRAGIGAPLILPGLMLFMRSLLDFHLVAWTEVHAGAIAIALLMAFLAARADKSLIENKMILLVFPLLIPYGYGVLIQSNALADMSPPKIYETRVLSKHYTTGKGAHPELKIESWGSDPGGDIAVSGALYKLVNPGGTVCVHLHKGALGVPWYYLDICHF